MLDAVPFGKVVAGTAPVYQAVVGNKMLPVRSFIPGKLTVDRSVKM
jgi:hypothetical protein